MLAQLAVDFQRDRAPGRVTDGGGRLEFAAGRAVVKGLGRAPRDDRRNLRLGAGRTGWFMPEAGGQELQ